jgi:uncharacterized protein YbjT (DUF2867 family)
MRRSNRFEIVRGAGKGRGGERECKPASFTSAWRIPAPVIEARIEVRTRCEGLIRQSGLKASVLRPWYVLGPRHYWPYLLKPGDWLARQIPSLPETATRLEMVTVEKMVAAFVRSLASRAVGIEIIPVPENRKPRLLTCLDC